MVATVSIIAPPLGSTAIDIRTTSDPYIYADTALNSLANGSSTSSITYSNPESRTYATVIIVLESITPTSGGTVQIISGSNGYELSVSTTTGPKIVKFINIATSFLSSFTVKNNTGVAFAASGNSVVIIPEY